MHPVYEIWIQSASEIESSDLDDGDSAILAWLLTMGFNPLVSSALSSTDLCSAFWKILQP